MAGLGGTSPSGAASTGIHLFPCTPFKHTASGVLERDRGRGAGIGEAFLPAPLGAVVWDANIGVLNPYGGFGSTSGCKAGHTNAADDTSIRLGSESGACEIKFCSRLA